MGERAGALDTYVIPLRRCIFSFWLIAKMTSVENKNTTKNQFRHTQLWNSIIVYMKANIQIKRHRRGIKYFNNSFNGTEFVEILYDYLMTNQKQFDRQVTKDKVIKVGIVHGWPRFVNICLIFGQKIQDFNFKRI